MRDSRILTLYTGSQKEKIAHQVMVDALSIYVKENGGKWPGADSLKVNEQFFWNMEKLWYGLNPLRKLGDVLDLIKQIFTKKIPGDWQTFKTFSMLYFPEINDVNNGEAYDLFSALLPIFQAYPKEENRKDFMTFAEPYLVRATPLKKNYTLYQLLLIFQAYPTPESRQDFMTFAEPYLEAVPAEGKPDRLYHLLPIFQAYPKEEDRKDFITFAEPFLKEGNSDDKSYRLSCLLPIFQAYPTPESQQEFMTFAEPYMRDAIVNQNDKIDHSVFLVPIFQAYPTPESRKAFLMFAEPFLVGKLPYTKPGYLPLLFSLFQACSKDNDFSRNFQSFIELHKKRMDLVLLTSYLPRTYLRYMRSLAAFNAENNASDARLQPLYETDIGHQLPVLWAEDPMLREIDWGRANAHDFDAVYELDRGTLFDWCKKNGYVDDQSPADHTIYNGSVITDHYQTNAEVEDFIGYLDDTVATGPALKLDRNEIPAKRVVSIIKQMLGLEAKSRDTTGDFAPYLGHSMYYAKPDGPKGDEMLGRVWFMMKKMGEGKPAKDLEDYKKSVVLTILEAAELSKGANTHCQTRMTGELMKAIAWHLPGSKLKSLIIADDLPPAAGDADIIARITKAPERAKSLFNIMKREDSVIIKALLEQHMIDGTDPELWERYQAYYDDLYRRTNDGMGGYKKDEHILMRDDLGNLVQNYYDANGQPRITTPNDIVYHQAEFQVFEKTFSELMKKEFEEQRGLVY